MAKRKRKLNDQGNSPNQIQKPRLSPSEENFLDPQRSKSGKPKTVQIITGSYDRVLHGIVATIPEGHAGDDAKPRNVVFNDNFLFNAHSSAIRCLALSPLPKPKEKSVSQKIILASGGTDERINLYSISTSVSPIQSSNEPTSSKPNGTLKLEKSKNKELGSLLHHSSNINVLHFPNRSKLLAGADDNTISVARTRDWTVLSTIKAPIPRVAGRPSGDTAPPGGTPAGINDFAVHPSMKLMISVGKGERCMRLWNLVTGKKAGVLNFEKHLLQAVKESKFSSGEARKVVWNSRGDEFVVGFDRGAVVFAMDSKPKGPVLASPISKLHQMQYLALQKEEQFVVSTEDGRLIFFASPETSSAGASANDGAEPSDILPELVQIAALGGMSAGVTARVKDFQILPLSGDLTSYLVITASSDGSIRLWKVNESDLMTNSTSTLGGQSNGKLGTNSSSMARKEVGQLLGSYKSENRITCLQAFILSDSGFDSLESDVAAGIDPEDVSESEFEGLD